MVLARSVSYRIYTFILLYFFFYIYFFSLCWHQITEKFVNHARFFFYNDFSIIYFAILPSVVAS